MGFKQMIEQMKKEFEEKYENSDIDEQLDIFARTMIINKYVGLDDIQYLVEEFKCPVNYKSKQEKILQDIDTIKMSSKLTALENHYDYMDSLVCNLKDNIEKVFGIPVSTSIVIDGYEYWILFFIFLNGKSEWLLWLKWIYSMKKYQILVIWLM